MRDITSQDRIEEFLKTLNMDQELSPADFDRAIKSAYQDRTRQVFFIWKAIKDLHPDIDANEIIRLGSKNFGLYQGKKIAEKAGSSSLSPIEALLGQTSRGGYSVFKQEIIKLEENEAIKFFNACPHVEALQEMGLNQEEVKSFCKDMLIACDYGIVEAFQDLKIEFPTTVSEGEGKPCQMIISRDETC